MLKKYSIVIFSILLYGCSNRGNVYNESDYLLVKTDSDNHTIASKFYLNKNDSLRSMQLDFWDNGKLLAKSFSNKKHLDGRFEMYTITGKIMTIKEYRNGILLSTKNFDTLGNIINR